MIRKLVVVGTTLALLIAGAIAAVGLPERSSPAVAAPPPVAAGVPVRTSAVGRSSLAGSLSYTGDVRARSQVHVIPKVAGRIVRLAVDVGDEVKAGDVLAELDRDQAKLQAEQATAALAAAEARLAQIIEGPRPEQVALAQANVDAAQARLDALQDGPRAEQIGQAQANLRAAEARLAQVKAGATAEQIAAAEAQVRLARNQLYLAQAQGDAVLGSRLPSTYTREQRDAQTGMAYEQIQLAEANLAGAKKGATDEQIAQADAAVDAARQQLALAKSPITSHDLAQARAAAQAAVEQARLAKAPFTEHDRQAARAAVDQARAALALARLQDAEATVRAPIAGVVAQKFLVEGALAGPTGPIVTLVSKEVEVVVNVEEAQIGRLKVGQAATIAVAAYPDKPLRGVLKLVSPTVDPASRTVAVKVDPAPGQDTLLPGMFAEVGIAADEKTSALAVPKAAVVARGGSAHVFVIRGGRAYRTPVRLGATEGALVEVLGGLAEGEVVAADNLPALTDGTPVVERPS
ncbi:MAG: efflux RND transporter periplasmic adaptor subunit [Chloroflexi bacterium]|nr:efflux RND transporter periplasmic adaptor subunit [Chloroflexota bacterium]